MTCLEVGTTRISWCDGRVQPIDPDAAPTDLLQRVASNDPYPQVNEYGCVLRPAHELYAALVSDAVHERSLDFGPDATIGLVAPAWWSTPVRERVSASIERLGSHVTLVNDAEAVIATMQQAGTELPGTVAVVHLRATYISVTIVETHDTPRALKRPTQMHPEGGNSLDAALLRHLVHGLNEAGDNVVVQSKRVIRAARAALLDSREVRESLSTSATATPQLKIPGARGRMRLVRSELEEIARPFADTLIETVRSTIDESPIEVEAVVIAGGLATMPLVSQRLSADLSLNVFVPEDPSPASLLGAERMIALNTRATSTKRSLWSFLTRRAAAPARAPRAKRQHTRHEQPTIEHALHTSPVPTDDVHHPAQSLVHR